MTSREPRPHDAGERREHNGQSTPWFRRVAVALVLATAALTVALALTGAAAGQIVVNDDGSGDHESIQDAVDAAEEGGEILVENGTYEGMVNVDVRGLSLYSGDNQYPVLEGEGVWEPALEIAATDVEVEGFEIRNYHPPGWGVVTVTADDVEVTGNHIRSNGQEDDTAAILVSDSINDTTLKWNALEGNDVGVSVQEDANSTAVEYNTIEENDAGLYYEGGGILDVTSNYWGAEDGPSGGVDDPETGETADGEGDSIEGPGAEEVAFDPWLEDEPEEVNAEFTFTPESPEQGETVEFDAENSTGEITEYRWDFDGDGEFDETTAEPEASHIYDEEGHYEARLEVEDEDRGVDDTTRSVSVGDDPWGEVDIQGSVQEGDEVLTVGYRFEDTDGDDAALVVENIDTGESANEVVEEDGETDLYADEVGGLAEGDELSARLYESPDMVTLLDGDEETVGEAGEPYGEVSFESPVSEGDVGFNVSVNFSDTEEGDVYLGVENIDTGESANEVVEGNGSVWVYADEVGGLAEGDELSARLYESPDMVTLLDNDSETVQPGVVEVEGCTVIDSGGSYELVTDITSNSTCIHVTADNVSFDGNGYTVEAGDIEDGVERGVWVDGADNVSVENLTTVGWDYGAVYSDANQGSLTEFDARDGGTGIYVGDSDDNEFEDVVAVNNTGRGVSVGPSSFSPATGNDLLDIEVTDNGDSGLYLGDGASSNTVIGVAAEDNGDGVTSEGSMNTLENLETHGNGQYGVDLDDAYNEDVDGVNSSDNGWHGLRVWESDANSISNVTVTGNEIRGVYLGGSSFGDTSELNEIYNLTAEDSYDTGIYLDQAVDNELSELTLHNNTGSSLELSRDSHDNTVEDVAITEGGSYGVQIRPDNHDNQFSNVTVEDTGSASHHDAVEVSQETSGNSFEDVDVTNSQGGVLIRGSNTSVTGLSVVDVDATAVSFRSFEDVASDNMVSDVYVDNATSGFIVRGENNTVADATVFDVDPAVELHEDPMNSVEDVTMTSTTVSATGVDVRLNAALDPGTKPDDMESVDEYVEANALSEDAELAPLRVYYSSEDLGDVEPETLEIWRYDGGWHDPVDEAYFVDRDTTEEYVYAYGVTEFSTFGVFGENTTEPVPEGWLSGQVTGNETPLEDAEVAAYGHETGEGNHTYTNETGYYNVTLPEDIYDVVFDHPDYVEETVHDVVVNEGETTVLDADLDEVPDPGSLSGTVYDNETGDRLNGVIVEVEDPDTGETWTEITDWLGSYEFEELQPGSYEATASDNQYYPETQLVSITEDETTTQDFHIDSSVNGEIEFESPVTEDQASFTVSYSFENTSMGDAIIRVEKPEEAVTEFTVTESGETAVDASDIGGYVEGDQIEAEIRDQVMSGELVYETTLDQDSVVVQDSVDNGDTGDDDTGGGISDPAFFDVEIDESETDAEVEVNSWFNVTVEVTNTGGEFDRQGLAVEFLGETRERTVELSSGGSERYNVSFEVGEDANSTERVEAQTEDDEDSMTVEIRRPDAPFFSVTVLEEHSMLEAVDGGVVSVTVNVSNEGATGDGQELTAELSGDTSTAELSLGPEESELIEFVLPVTLDDDGGSLTVASSDDSDQVEIQVSERYDSGDEGSSDPAFFDVEIDEADSDLEAEHGGEVDVTVTVTNTGDVVASQELEVELLGESYTENLRVHGTRSETHEFSFTVEEEDDGARVTASTADDSDSAAINVESMKPAYFDVDVLEADSELEVLDGAEAVLEVNVSNTGDLKGTQEVVAGFDDDGVTQNLSLEGGEHQTVNYSLPVVLADDGRTMSVESQNDPDSAELSVSPVPPERMIDIEEMETGESATVTVTATWGAPTNYTVFEEFTAFEDVEILDADGGIFAGSRSSQDEVAVTYTERTQSEVTYRVTAGENTSAAGVYEFTGWIQTPVYDDVDAVGDSSIDVGVSPHLNRDVARPSLEPGDSTTVSLDVHAGEPMEFTVSDSWESAGELEVVDADGGTVSDGAGSQSIEVSFTDRESASIEYTATLSEDAEDGEVHAFTGAVDRGVGEPIEGPGGDVVVVVGGLGDAEALHSEQRELEMDGDSASAWFSDEASTESVEIATGVEGSVSVAELDREPSDFEESPGSTLGSYRFLVPDDAEDSEATLQKRINRDELERQNISAEEVRVYHRVDGEWTALETTVVEEDSEEVLLEVHTPGFSYFAVSVDEDEGDTGGGFSSLIALALMTALLAAAVVAFGFSSRKD